MSDFLSSASDVLDFIGAVLALALEVRRLRRGRKPGPTENGPQDDGANRNDSGGQDAKLLMLGASSGGRGPERCLAHIADGFGL
ncbi:hypothetical protein ABZY44_29640 [Streptomyces sp. NPDC006544]|uniref:hypothetical protein n=1 Tax=Streptomyces sp. NPDC006544 TaxID=3154583 RepID=UPI0033ACFD24